MSKAQIDLTNFDFNHLQNGNQKAGVVYFLGEENAVVVDAAGTAFEGKDVKLNQCGAAGLSKVIGSHCPNRPIIENAKVDLMTAGKVERNRNNLVTTIPPHAAALNLANKDKVVIHAVGPVFSGKADDFRNGLKETFKNIFSVWQNNPETKDKELYLPFISGAIFGGSNLGDEYYKIFIEELEACASEIENVDIAKIHIVAFQQKEVEAVTNFLTSRSSKEKDDEKKAPKIEEVKENAHKERQVYSQESNFGNAAETIGRRDGQQDSIAVVPYQNTQDPSNFIEENLSSLEKRCSKYDAGTTACVVIVDSDNIHVGNKGDSQCVLVIGYKDGSEKKYVSVALTQDLKPTLPRVQSLVENSGNQVFQYEGARVNGNLAVGASLGDKSCFTDRLTGVVSSAADINTFSLPEILGQLNINPDSVESSEVVLACDGLSDVVDNKNSYEKDGEGKFVLQSGESSKAKDLASIRAEWELGDKSQPFSQYCVNQALTLGSTDNISVAVIPIKNGEKVMGVVADGHGTANAFENNVTEFLAGNVSTSSGVDGSIVSANVAAFMASQAGDAQAVVSPCHEGHPFKKALGEIKAAKASGQITPVLPDRIKFKKNGDILTISFPKDLPVYELFREVFIDPSFNDAAKTITIDLTDEKNSEKIAAYFANLTLSADKDSCEISVPSYFDILKSVLLLGFSEDAAKAQEIKRIEDIQHIRAFFQQNPKSIEIILGAKILEKDLEEDDLRKSEVQKSYMRKIISDIKDDDFGQLIADFVKYCSDDKIFKDLLDDKLGLPVSESVIRFSRPENNYSAILNKALEILKNENKKDFNADTFAKNLNSLQAYIDKNSKITQEENSHLKGEIESIKSQSKPKEILSSDQKTKAILTSLTYEYQDYLKRFYANSNSSKDQLQREVSSANVVVIEQGHHAGRRTDPVFLINTLKASVSLQGKEVHALNNSGNAFGGHWDFITSRNSNGAEENYKKTAISGVGLACGAYTVMRILGQSKQQEVIDFAKALGGAGFAEAEINSIVSALKNGQDLTDNNGKLARKFVAEIVKAEMRKNECAESEIAVQVHDVNTKQIEQENLKRVLNHFGIAVVRYDQIVSSLEGNEAAQTFEEYVLETIFKKDADGQYETTPAQRRKQLIDRSNQSVVDNLEQKFRNAHSRKIPISEVSARAEIDEVEVIFSTLKDLQKDEHYRDEKFLTGNLDIPFIFPNQVSLKKFEVPAANINDVQQKLAQDSDYAKNYFNCVKKYLLACGYDCDKDPAFESADVLSKGNKRFSEVVASFIELTDGNKRLLSGLNKDQQDKLLRDLQNFATATNQAENEADEQYKPAFNALKTIFAALPPLPAKADLAPSSAVSSAMAEPPLSPLPPLSSAASAPLPSLAPPVSSASPPPASSSSVAPPASSSAALAPAALAKAEKKIEIVVSLQAANYVADENMQRPPIVAQDGKLYINKKDKTEVAGAQVYYEVVKENGVDKAKFFTQEEAAADPTKKSWRQDVMKYYHGATGEIPKPAVQAISVIALSAKEASRSGGRAG